MKRQYRIRNWKEYNAGLKQRGSLSFWVSEEVIQQWTVKEKSGRPGASLTYSDIAIATMATVKSMFHLGGRQAQGFLESLFGLMGVSLSVPDHSTLSRRLGSLNVAMPVKPTDHAPALSRCFFIFFRFRFTQQSSSGNVRFIFLSFGFGDFLFFSSGVRAEFRQVHLCG